MPEFILESDGVVNTNPPKTFDELDPFTQGYIEAFFFTNQSCFSMTEWDDEETQEAIREGQADGDLPSDAGFSDLHPASLDSIIADCAAFQTEHADLLALAYERDYDAAQAGRDFLYTRAGHGVGYWDREVLEAQGEEWDALQRPLDTWTAEEGKTFDRLKSESLGQRLSDACGRHEVCASFDQAADGLESPTGYGFVFVD